MNELQPQNHSDTCLDAGLLVSLRDEELTSEEMERIKAHLAVCPDCAADERGMRAASKEMYDVLTVLGPSPSEIPDTKVALSALQAKLAAQSGREERPSGDEVSHVRAGGDKPRPYNLQLQERVGGGKTRHKRRWLVGAVAAALIALLVLPNARVLASQFLALFTVQQFQPVSVDPQSFRNGIGEDLQKFGDVRFNYPDQNGIQNPTQAQVEQKLSFKLLLPGQLPRGISDTAQFSLIDSVHGTFTFRAAQARAYLASTGQGNVAIPAQLDGATYTVTSAPGVIIHYGSGNKPFYIGEIPSPVIQATGKASLKELRDFVLSLPKLSPEVSLLLRDVNLDSGVVPLPIPPQVQAQNVTVQGVPGVSMVDSSLSVGAVIWQTHGIIYVVAGAASSEAQLLDSANSLH
jgi:hypothetical protein